MDLAAGGMRMVPPPMQPRTKPRADKAGKVDVHCTLMFGFSRAELMAHLKSLRDDFHAGISTSMLRSYVMTLLTTIMGHQHAWIFASPVDPYKLNLPDYFDIVKRPMDLRTVQRRLDNDMYRTFGAFANDVRLIFQNALLYNPVRSCARACACAQKLHRA